MIRIRPTLAWPAPRWSGTARCWMQLRWQGTTGRPRGHKDNWSPERLATSSEYPLTETLRNLMHPGTAKKKSVGKKKKHQVNSANTVSDSHVRTQLVSPGLCDDVLAYSRDILDKHKGGDILDINPGAGLWSQKLHDFLQPRSHVLLEPNHALFKDHLDPLLNAPNSRYKLLAKDPLSIPSYRDLVDERVFPHQTRVDPTDPNAQQPNNTLLITGSLVWDPRLPGMGFDSMAKQLYHHFASAAWTNDLFHAFGPVHTLFWVQSDDFNPMIAQAVAGMQKSNRLLEMTQTITMLVGSKRNSRVGGRGSITREPQDEIQSVMRALQAGREKGIHVPEQRRDDTYYFATDIEKASAEAGTLPQDLMRSEFMPDFLRRQQLAGKSPVGLAVQSWVDNVEMEKQITNEYPDITTHPLLIRPSTYSTSYKNHPAKDIMKGFMKGRSQIYHAIMTRKATEAIVDMGEKLYLLECKALKMKEGPEREAVIKTIEELDSAWDHALTTLSSNIRIIPVTNLDERINIRYAPGPRIQWDKRPFEPLMSRPDEAWPANRLSLVYASPNPKPLGDTPDWTEWITDFISALFTDSARPIGVALDSLHHGLSDIMKDCPSLQDPDKGGRMLLKHLRVRMLTMEMIFELVKAYRDWPFRPPGTDNNMYFRNKARLGGRGRGMVYDAFAGAV